jgi:hypothetical protein
MRTELAAAIAEIKEFYERECAGLKEPIDARDHDLPQQRTDNPEAGSDEARTEAEGARARAARAAAALAAEHEKLVAAEVELDRLRAEIEGEHERTRAALEQAKAASERWQRANAEVMQLRHEIEVGHYQAEQEHARLVEEADGLGQRLEAAETDAAQLRQALSASQSFGRWPRLLAATTSVLLGIAVAWLLFPEPAKERIISTVVTIPTSWVSAKERIFGKLQPTTTTATPATTTASPAPQPAATRLESGRAQIQSPTQVGSNSPTQQDKGDRPQTSGNEQQPSPAPPVQDKVPEANSPPPLPSNSVSSDAPPEAGNIHPQASDSVPEKEQTDATQQSAPAKVGPPQPEPTPVGDKVTPSPPQSRLPTTSTSLPTSGTVAAHVSVHYRQGSPPERGDAERVATWLASSGFGASQLLGTRRAFREQAVRYFFAEDAETARRIVGELRQKGGKWQAEDCRSYRHKPPAGRIEVWLITFRRKSSG